MYVLTADQSLSPCTSSSTEALCELCSSMDGLIDGDGASVSLSLQGQEMIGHAGHAAFGSLPKKNDIGFLSHFPSIVLG